MTTDGSARLESPPAESRKYFFNQLYLLRLRKIASAAIVRLRPMASLGTSKRMWYHLGHVGEGPLKIVDMTAAVGLALRS